MLLVIIQTSLVPNSLLNLVCSMDLPNIGLAPKTTAIHSQTQLRILLLTEMSCRGLEEKLTGQV